MQTFFVQIITVLIESVVVVGLIRIVVHEELYCVKAINADLNLMMISKSIATESKSIFKAVASLRV